MKLNDLKHALEKANISANTYSLEGGHPFEQYCIEENYGKWSIYYSEKGVKVNEKLFYSEDEACHYFYKLLLKDPSTKEKKPT